MAEGLKWRVNNAVTRSTLPPHARLVMFVLANRADTRTAVIPDDHTPSLADLADDSGLGLATVKRHLNILEADGWVVRERPTDEERVRGVRTRYRLAIGKAPTTTQPEPEEDRDTAQPEPSEHGSQRAVPGLTVSLGTAQAEPRHGSQRAVRTAQAEPSTYIPIVTDLSDQLLGADAPSGETAGALFGADTEGVETTPANKPGAKPKRTKKPEPQRDDVDALCNRLHDLMIANGCKPPTITEKWKTEARLLLDTDGRDLDDALNVLEWSQYDKFWKPNIHSIPTFREKYDTLRQRRDQDREALAAKVVPMQRNGHTAFRDDPDRDYSLDAYLRERNGA